MKAPTAVVDAHEVQRIVKETLAYLKSDAGRADMRAAGEQSRKEAERIRQAFKMTPRILNIRFGI
jgi:hypothetical protein